MCGTFALSFPSSLIPLWEVELTFKYSGSLTSASSNSRADPFNSSENYLHSPCLALSVQLKLPSLLYCTKNEIISMPLV